LVEAGMREFRHSTGEGHDGACAVSEVCLACELRRCPDLGLAERHHDVVDAENYATW
jgi:hypothetical protein